ncbi:MAG TPA: aminotransferase class V-fold PLP-dependent enzyme [Dyella sp.]|uniref:aminotransferase class V-fold PLP-dependent enzyme n=1 Tax=Dyella sp. TaxID=1869338 RepID=UPI002F93910C
MSIAPLLSPELFDFPDETLWLAHCKDGPMPRAAAAMLEALLRTELRPWELRWNEDFLDVEQRLRDAGAALLGVSAQDISLVSCTSTGLQAIALGYPWQPGDEVVIPAGEFPSNRLPWLALERLGVHCVEVPLWPEAALPDTDIEPEQRLLQAITPRTRMVAASWVRFQDGIRLDLDRLGQGCRERGVHLIVDGIQGAGTAVPDLRHASAFATGGHKGLLGGQGQGLLWTNAALRRQLMPLGTWLSAPSAFSQAGTQGTAACHWASDGRYLEAGSPTILGCGALAASIERLLAVGGAAAIEAHVTNLQQRLLQRLRVAAAWKQEADRLQRLIQAGRTGSILSFACPQPVIDELLQRGQAQGINASTREGFLRIALHAWHGSVDVDRCAQWMMASP